MNTRRSIAATLVGVLSLALSPAPAQLGEGSTVVTAELVSEVSAIAPGKPFTVAVKMVHEETWHTYWRNSAYIQLPPRIKWELPEGFEAGELQWPVPEKMVLQGFVAYVYGHTNYLLAEITPPDSIAPGSTVELKASARWQHCDPTRCVPASAKLSLPLAVADAPQRNDAVHAALEKVRTEQLPMPLADWKVDAYANAKGIQLVLTPDGDGANIEAEEVYFLSADKKIDGQEAQKAEKMDGKLVLPLKRNADYDGEDNSTLPGVLIAKTSLVKNSTAAGFGIDPKLTEGDPPVDVPSASGADDRPLGIILLFGLIGGLILNLMPCVFPVIGLKIMSFVNKAGEERHKITIHGLVFTAGILISFWVLAAVFFVLKSQVTGSGEGGTSWGFQLQNPWFAYIILLVIFVLALNMAGVFEIGTSAVGVGSKLTAKGGYAGSFFSGVLATVVATPCSAPFLGTALGAVASMPAVPFFATFTAIALGLALPYIVLSAFPDLVQQLPAPGPWMESFKQGMSFLLFGTAGYLMWNYDGLVESTNSLYALLGLSVIALALWVYGRWSAPSRPKATRFRAVVIAALFFVFGAWFGHPKPSDLTWEPWSPQLVDQLREAGEPVYIDFTARWCATCQTNKASYKDEKIREAVENKGIRLLIADNTKEDPVIGKAINDLNKIAVPVNVLYVPGQDEPEILPELLTTGIVLDFFEKVPDKE